MALKQPTHQNFVTQHYLYAGSKPSPSWTWVNGEQAQPPAPYGIGVFLAETNKSDVCHTLSKHTRA